VVRQIGRTAKGNQRKVKRRTRKPGVGGGKKTHHSHPEELLKSTGARGPAAHFAISETNWEGINKRTSLTRAPTAVRAFESLNNCREGTAAVKETKISGPVKGPSKRLGGSRPCRLQKGFNKHKGKKKARRKPESRVYHPSGLTRKSESKQRERRISSDTGGVVEDNKRKTTTSPPR